MSSKNRRPVVCFIVTIETTASNFLNGYLRHLHNKGWDVWLIASSQGGLLQFAESQHAQGAHVAMERNPSSLRDLASFAKLLRQLARIKPDVLVVATPKASLLGGLAGFVLRIPVRIYQQWGLRLESASGVQRYILSTLERLTMKVSTQVLANSESLARRTQELGISPRRPIRVLGPGSSHGVDVDRFSPDCPLDDVDQATASFLNKNPERLILGFVGRLHVDKGIDTLVEALFLCADADLELNVIVVGSTESEQLINSLTRASSSIRIHLVGRVSDPRPYYRAMDMLCLPSRREGFPNVVLEAAAMGKPTIASDATGVVDSVVDGLTGLIFKTDDAKDLARAIFELSSNEEDRLALGEGALRHVRASYRAEQIWKLQEANIRAEYLAKGSA